MTHRRSLSGRRGLSGLTNEGSGPTAKFTIGLRVDKPRPGSITKKVGSKITPARAEREVLKLRREQVGATAASATLADCRGHWEGAQEPTLTCEIEHIPSPKEQRQSAFKRNMLSLGEHLAERLGQKEVWIRLGGNLYRANAPNERGPAPLRTRGRRVK